MMDKNTLQHYGVIGMKWGIRRALSNRFERKKSRMLKKADRISNKRALYNEYPRFAGVKRIKEKVVANVRNIFKRKITKNTAKRNAIDMSLDRFTSETDRSIFRNDLINKKVGKYDVRSMRAYNKGLDKVRSDRILNKLAKKEAKNNFKNQKAEAKTFSEYLKAKKKYKSFKREFKDRKRKAKELGFIPSYKPYN